ncbi:MAG: ribosome maturation factor RimM [Oscillospiraceae bacterium]|nr:ribosome maturation factor RimM [Oscillospiraceae bacterium]
MLQQYLEAGKIVGTHGVRGELRVEPWCDSPAFLKRFKTLYWKQNGTFIPVAVRSARVHKNLLLVLLEGIDSIEQGDPLRGRVLYLDRKDARLPKGRFFIADLLGVEVFDADTDQRYGKVTEVFQTGANDVYEVTGDDGRKYLLPVVEHIVLDTDIEGRRMTVRPIKGIFDHED